MKDPLANTKAYRQAKYASGPSGKNRLVVCKWCKKPMRSDILKRHIGLVHEKKATKKQREAA